MSAAKAADKLPSTDLITTSATTESAFSRLIVAPVLFVSFLLSLFIVEQKTHDTVFSSPHSHSPSRSPTRSSLDGSSGSAGDAVGNQERERFYHSHQKKLAKQEFADAFEMRNKVLAGFVMAGGVGVAALSWGWMKMWSVVSR